MLVALLPVVLTIGTGLALVQRRGFAGTAADLRGELLRLSEVQLAVADARTASARARADARSVR
jgi:hypothetical protein